MDFSWLYKGRSIENSSVWYIGGLMIYEKGAENRYKSEECYITDFDGNQHQVDPYFIYKSTGLFNADGELIWEGDHVHIDYLDFSPEDGDFVIAWDQEKAKFIASNEIQVISFDRVFANHSKVVYTAEDYV